MFLKHLLVDYHSSSFSRAYRQILKDTLKRDSGFPVYPADSREYFVLDCVMSGFIEQLIQCLDADMDTLEAFRLAHGMMESGAKNTLEQQFGIVTGEKRMK